MGSSTGKLTTKAIAVIVIVAMLDAVGLSPVIMVLITGMVFVVWLCARRAQAREVERIFDFYIAADAILREEERRWYGFEITEVIEHGESLLDIIPDPPSLRDDAATHRVSAFKCAADACSNQKSRTCAPAQRVEVVA